MIEIKTAGRWKKTKLFTLFNENKQKNTDFTVDHALQFYFGTIIPKKRYELTDELIETYRKYTVVQPGDIMINGLNLNYDFVSQRIGYVREEGIITSAYISLRSRSEDANTAYYNYLFKAVDSQKLFHGMGTGIRLTLSYNELKYLELPVPPREEQDQIVRYLDWKVSSINKLLAIKRKQLLCTQELINKQYQILSQKSFRQSKLKYFAHLSNDFIPIDNNEYYSKTGMYNRGRGIFRREAILGEYMGDSSFQRIHSGCVMISGQFAWEAATYVTTKEDEKGVASHRYYLLVPEGDFPAEYIWCFLMSDYGQMQMKLCSHGAAGRNRPLNIKELMNVYFPVPVTGKELDVLVQSVRGLMKLRTSVLELELVLRELSSHIISDAVTGKIDVRGIEIPEYEFVDGEADSDVEDTDGEEESEEQED